MNRFDTDKLPENLQPGEMKVYDTAPYYFKTRKHTGLFSDIKSESQRNLRLVNQELQHLSRPSTDTKKDIKLPQLKTLKKHKSEAGFQNDILIDQINSSLTRLKREHNRSAVSNRQGQFSTYDQEQ